MLWVHLSWWYCTTITTLTKNRAYSRSCQIFHKVRESPERRSIVHTVMIIWRHKWVEYPFYQYVVHWIKCLQLHLNLLHWHPLGEVFRDVVIIDRWPLNEEVSIEIQGRAESVIYWPNTFSLFYLPNSFEESLYLCSFAAQAFTEVTPDIFEIVAFRDFLFPIPCLLPFCDVEQSLRLVLLWRSEPLLPFSRCPSSEQSLMLCLYVECLLQLPPFALPTGADR